MYTPAAVAASFVAPRGLVRPVRIARFQRVAPLESSFTTPTLFPELTGQLRYMLSDGSIPMAAPVAEPQPQNTERVQAAAPVDAVIR